VEAFFVQPDVLGDGREQAGLAEDVRDWHPQGAAQSFAQFEARLGALVDDIGQRGGCYVSPQCQLSDAAVAFFYSFLFDPLSKMFGHSVIVTLKTSGIS